MITVVKFPFIEENFKFLRLSHTVPMYLMLYLVPEDSSRLFKMKVDIFLNSYNIAGKQC